MALVGYARVSSVGQSLAVQREKLQGCTRIFEDQRSGTSAARPGLVAALDYVGAGDTLVVTRLDRLARSTLHLCQIAAQLRQKGVALRVIDQAIDTSDATGRQLFPLLGALAQFETEIRAERQLDGIANARARGVPLGRQHALSPAQIAELRERRRQGALVKTLMAEYGLGRSTIYRYLDGAIAAAVADSKP